MKFLKKLGFGNKEKTKPKGPYKNETLNMLYHMSFCDDINFFKSIVKDPSQHPISEIIGTPFNKEGLLKVAKDTTLDTRCRLFAYDRLLKNKIPIKNVELLGVIIEIGFEQGMDVLAAYQDGNIRYLNQGEAAIVWETPNETSNALVEKVFAASQEVVQNIGPWTDGRTPWPDKNFVKITFLVSNGLYFGQGPINIMFNDPKAGAILAAGTELMTYLTKQPSQNQ